MPVQVNAHLTRIRAATAATGGRDDWDAPGAEPAGAGAVKWEAPGPELNAYYREKARRPADGVGDDVVTDRTLIIDSTVARAAGVDTDDVLEYVDPDGQARTARAATVAIAELPGIPASLQTARLELELT